MRAEELRHRITFQKLETSISDNGFEVERWLDTAMRMLRLEKDLRTI